MFYEDYLVAEPREGNPHFGKLVTVPSYSPEAAFRFEGKDDPSVQQPYLTIGAMMDFQLIHEVFSNLIEASKILGVDADKRKDWQLAIDSIPPLQVGKHGQLQEWLQDYEDFKVNHRHISHLYGLFPGDQITPEDTPEFARAAYVSLVERRMNPELRRNPKGILPEHTVCAWSAVRSWYAACFARLGKPERAYELLHSNLSDKRLKYRNLITRVLAGCEGDAVFQIDGNGAAPAAIAEMLMQSHNGEIKLLPALPKGWLTGHIKGLVARGAFEVDIEWKDGELAKAAVISRVGNVCNLRYRDKTLRFKTRKGERYIFNNELKKIGDD